MEKNLFKSIIETVMSAALCALCILLAFNFPTFALFVVLISGLPLVFVCSRRGGAFGIIAFLIAVVAVFLMVGDIKSTLLTALIFLLPGLSFGVCASFNVKYVKSLLITSAVVLCGFVVELIIANGDGNGIRTIINQSFSGVVSNFEQLIPNEEMKIITGGVSFAEIAGYAAEELIKYIPALVILLSAIYGYCTVMMGIFVYNRVSGKKYDYIKFNMMSAPKSVCIITMLIVIFSWFLSEDSTISLALTNLAFVSEGFIGLCGLSMLDFWFSRAIKKGFLRALIYIGALLFGFMILAILPTALVLLGYADGLFNLRMRFKRGGDTN